MRRAYINNKNDFVIFILEFSIKFFYPLVKKETAHPTFWLRTITTWQAFNMSEASRFHQEY